MQRLLTTSVTIQTVTVPTPPVEFEDEDIELPDLEPIDMPEIDFGPFRFSLPDVSIPATQINIPDVDVSFEREELSIDEEIFVPDVELPTLDIDTDPVTIPVADFTIYVVDPLDSELEGGHVGFDRVDIPDPSPIFVPDVDVTTDPRIIDGASVSFPDVDIPRLAVDIPDVPGLELPTLSVPVDATLRGEIDLPDPTGIDVDVGVDWGRVQAFVLDPVPSWAIGTDVTDLVDAVLAGVERSMDVVLLERLRDIAEGLLEVALSADTKAKARALTEGT